MVYKSTEAVRKYRAANKEKVREQTRIQARNWARNNPEAHKKWARENPERQKEIARKSNLKKIGWTLEDFAEAFENQKESCWICNVSLTREPGFGNTAHADHNHSTGKKRGILCAKCDLIEGHMDKCAISPTEFLAKLIEYYQVFDVESEQNNVCAMDGDSIVFQHSQVPQD